MSRHRQGMSGKVQRALGYGKEPLYGEETAPCPKCRGTLEMTLNEIGQMVETCPDCHLVKLHRGRRTTE